MVSSSQLAGRVRHRRVDQQAQGPWLIRFCVGAARFIPRAPLRRRWSARTEGASIPFGSNLDENRHVEPRQMAQAHDRIHPMQVANLPPAATALRPFLGALNVDEPVSLLSPMRREDADVGQVQRHVNTVVHRASPTKAVPRSSYKSYFRTLSYRGAHHGNSRRAALFRFAASAPETLLQTRHLARRCRTGWTPIPRPCLPGYGETRSSRCIQTVGSQPDADFSGRPTALGSDLRPGRRYQRRRHWY